MKIVKKNNSGEKIRFFGEIYSKFDVKKFNFTIISDFEQNEEYIGFTNGMFIFYFSCMQSIFWVVIMA